MPGKAKFLAQIRQGRLQAVHHVAVLQPERVIREQVLDLRRQFAGAAAQFHQPVQQRAHGNAGVRMRLVHRLGESPQAGEVLFHGARP